MKKNIINLLTIILSGILYSQVGINTQKPQGALHVDGAKDNPSTGSTLPTATQQLNDLIVTSAGNVGVGLIVPTQKIDVQGNIRVREPLSGSNIIDFPSAVVMKADGTIGTTRASNVSLQSFQLRIPSHSGAASPDFNNHTNTTFDSDNWWVIQKTSFNSVANVSPSKMTIVYEYQGPAFSNAANIFASLTTGNNSGFPDVFVASFISLQTVGGKSRLTVTIARTDHFVNAWAGTFLLNTLLAIKP